MPRSYLKALIIQFTKAPEINSVKTRLASVLNEHERQEIHCAMTDWVCKQLHSIGYKYELWVAGDMYHDFIQSLRVQYHIELRQQMGQSLGERLANAVDQGLVSHQAVIIVGSDCPFIDRHYLNHAIHQLEHSDVVIGPATDGGYVLLGLKRFTPELFTDVPWGSDQVLTATLNKIDQTAITVHLLPVLSDIDLPADLSTLNNPNLPNSLRQFAK